MQFVLGHITTKDKLEAEKIGRSLLKEKLVACVNIIDKISSGYWWEGKIENSQECLLLIKSKKSLTKKIINHVKTLHSYDCPCIIFLPIVYGSPDYLNWIEQSTI